jgi:hypothetical protein
MSAAKRLVEAALAEPREGYCEICERNEHDCQCGGKACGGKTIEELLGDLKLVEELADSIVEKMTETMAQVVMLRRALKNARAA